jgi:hypothetical protein
MAETDVDIKKAVANGIASAAKRVSQISPRFFPASSIINASSSCRSTLSKIANHEETDMTSVTSTETSEESGFNGIAPQRLKNLVLSSDGHVFDTKTGRSYRINPSGQLTLQLMQEGKPEQEVISQLAARYAQHASVVAVGTKAFFSQLKRYLP